VNQKGSAATGVGAGTGKAEFDDFEFTIDTQFGSSLLMKHCALGTAFSKVILHVRKAGGGQREFLRYVFGNCILSSFSTSGDEESTDTVKFNYRAIHTKYFQQKDDGTIDTSKPTSEGGYDLKLNAAWPDGPGTCADMKTEPVK
jgi:type VI secretion system secreted protein Hcp